MATSKKAKPAVMLIIAGKPPKKGESKMAEKREHKMTGKMKGKC